MDASGSPALPAWVRKRKGGLEPFDADRINRALFAAAERLGRADAFIARELTDSVLHFLALECEGGTVTSAQIAETLVKVVGELGQAPLAAAFTQGQQDKHASGQAAPVDSLAEPHKEMVLKAVGDGPSAVELERRLARPVLSGFSLESVYARNLAAAHAEGLLSLGGLDTPLELDSAVIRATSAGGGLTWASGVFEIVEQARRYVGRCLALDSPEREFTQRGARIGDAAVWIKELDRAARTLGVDVLLNLGSVLSPAWAAEAASGPLFLDQARHESTQGTMAFLDGLTDQVLHQQPVRLRIDWHLAPRDFEEEAGRRRLLRLARAALNGGPVRFVCDRPRREVSLGEGLDRNHHATLLWVGLHLPTLLRRHERKLEPDAFVSKVMSLARLAVSAGVQKRDFIRRLGRAERPAFMLERAQLVIHVMGLIEVAHQVLPRDDSLPTATWTFTQELLRRLETTLAQEGRQLHLKCLVDDSPAEAGGEVIAPPGAEEDLRGWLKSAGRWHVALGRGTLTIPVPPALQENAESLIELLQHIRQQTALNRVRLAKLESRATQLTAAWHQAER